MNNGWESNGNEDYLHIKDLGNRQFAIVSMVWLDTCPASDKCYVVCATTIDLKMIGIDEIEIALSNYGYDDIKDYEKEVGLPIGKCDYDIAEMIYDTYCINDGTIQTDLITKEEAKAFIYKWCAEH